MTASEATVPDADGAPAADSRTLPRLLAQRARRHPGRVALQEKRYGIWQPLTWRDCDEQVRDLAHGLAWLGVQRGQAVAVIGDNRPEWLLAEFAAHALGAAIVGVDPDSSDDEIARALDLADVRVAVVAGQQQVDQLIDRGRQLAAVVYYDPHGLEQYAEPYLHEFAEVQRRGRAWGEDRPGWLDARVAEGGPEDVALIHADAGDRVELTHRGLLAAADRLTAVDPVTAQHRYVCLLPLGSLSEQVHGVACAVTRGMCLSFPEQVATQRDDLREIGPDVVFAPPRFWEALLAEVRERLADAGRLKRAVFGWGYGVADGVVALRMRGLRPGLPTRLAHLIADWTALRPVRDHLGLLRTRRCYTGGAPLAPDVLGFFHALGVNLKQTYGTAVLGGVVAVHRDGAVTGNTVGVPLPGIEVELSGRGEILLRAAGNRGWLHTGDLGELDDDGHLVVLGRPPDVVAADDGRRYGRAHIEAALRSSPHLDEAVVVGEPQSAGLGALVAIDPRAVASRVQRGAPVPAGLGDLTARREVCDLVADEIDRATGDLPEIVRVRRFALLPGPFGSDEITPAGEVRREVIASRYADLLDALQRGDGAGDPRIHRTPGTAAQRRPAWWR